MGFPKFQIKHNRNCSLLRYLTRACLQRMLLLCGPTLGHKDLPLTPSSLTGFWFLSRVQREPVEVPSPGGHPAQQLHVPGPPPAHPGPQLPAPPAAAPQWRHRHLCGHGPRLQEAGSVEGYCFRTHSHCPAFFQNVKRLLDKCRTLGCKAPCRAGLDSLPSCRLINMTKRGSVTCGNIYLDSSATQPKASSHSVDHDMLMNSKYYT